MSGKFATVYAEHNRRQQEEAREASWIAAYQARRRAAADARLAELEARLARLLATESVSTAADIVPCHTV